MEGEGEEGEEKKVRTVEVENATACEQLLYLSVYDLELRRGGVGSEDGGASGAGDGRLEVRVEVRVFLHFANSSLCFF